MKTYPISDQLPQHCWAFEIENIYLTRARIAKLLLGVTEVSGVVVLRTLKDTDGVRLTFKYRSHDFVVWEPYGDSSRYWIGPDEENDKSQDLEAIRIVFERYQPPFIWHIAGALVMVDLKEFLSAFRVFARHFKQ